MNKFELAQTFISIVDKGSITKAAQILNQTPAAVSKKLTRLEAHLATELIARKGKEFHLTEAGQRYYSEVKKALNQFELAEQGVEQKNQKPQGLLKVVANEFYAKKWIMPKLAAFLKKFPDLELSIETAEILPNFSVKKMDILFGVSGLAPENLVQKRIDSTRYVLCASPNYFKGKSEPKSPSELLQYDFIAHSSRLAPNTIQLDKNKLELKIRCQFNHSDLMIQAALLGLGFIWTHENLVLELIEQKKMQIILEKYTQKSINVYAYYEYKQRVDAKIKAFMDFFLS